MYNKGEMVKYKAGQGYVSAIVKARHKTGGVTVEARHHLDEKGQPVGPYLGFKFRLPVSGLTERSSFLAGRSFACAGETPIELIGGFVSATTLCARAI